MRKQSVVSWKIRIWGLLLGLAVLFGSPSPAVPAGGAPPEGGALPPAPQWVGAADQLGQAQLTWIRNPSFTAVRVYRRATDSGGPFELVAEVGENSFLDTAVEPGKTYRYRLAGVGADGREGKASAELVVRVSAVVRSAPRPPEWEGYLAVADGIGLKWVSRQGEDVIAYNIYRKLPSETGYTLVGSSRGTSYHDIGLEAGQLYVYVLTALDSSFRETPYSLELPVRFVPPKTEPQQKAAAEWVVRRTRLVALVSKGDVPLLRPADVAVGPASGNVYVADSGRGRIFVFNGQGVFQRSVGAVGPSGGALLKNVLGLGFGPDENLHAVDAGTGAVQIFNNLGRPGRRLELPRPAQGIGLIDVAVGGDGRMYVVDNFSGQVTIAGGDGNLQVFGSPGSKAGEFSAPTFCALDVAGNFYVSDALNARVQVFSPSGEFVRAFGRAEKGPGGFGRPKGIAVSAAGEIYVADSWLNTVQVFDASGRFVAVLGDENGKPLDLGSPNGIALGPGNRLYVAERLAARLQIRELPDEKRRDEK